MVFNQKENSKMKNKPLFESVVINVRSPEGNAFYIMSVIKRLMKIMGESEENINAVIADMKSSDYKHLCDVASKYVVLIDEEDDEIYI